MKTLPYVQYCKTFILQLKANSEKKFKKRRFLFLSLSVPFVTCALNFYHHSQGLRLESRLIGENLCPVRRHGHDWVIVT